jgi:hypothetical protein
MPLLSVPTHYTCCAWRHAYHLAPFIITTTTVLSTRGVKSADGGPNHSPIHGLYAPYEKSSIFLGLLKPSLHENLIGTRSTETYCTIQATTPKFALRTIRSYSARLSAVDHSLSGSKSQLAASSPPSPHCSLALAL